MSTKQTTDQFMHAAFPAAQAAAKAWRCWDRTESQNAEDRIVDGAAWGILLAIAEGKIPHPDMAGVEVVTPATMKVVREALRKYGQHTVFCEYRTTCMFGAPSPAPCTCGLTEALGLLGRGR